MFLGTIESSSGIPTLASRAIKFTSSITTRAKYTRQNEGRSHRRRRRPQCAPTFCLSARTRAIHRIRKKNRTHSLEPPPPSSSPLMRRTLQYFVPIKIITRTAHFLSACDETTTTTIAPVCVSYSNAVYCMDVQCMHIEDMFRTLSYPASPERVRIRASPRVRSCKRADVRACIRASFPQIRAQAGEQFRN